MRLSGLRKQIFGVHFVQEISFQLAKKFGQQVEIQTQSYR